MYIKRIKVKNFRTLQKKSGEFEMEFDKNFQIIAGANNSGKSNLLRALNLFFNDTLDGELKYKKKRDLAYSKVHSSVEIEIIVDLFLEKKDIKNLKIKESIIQDNIIRTKVIYNANGERFHYYSNPNGKFPIKKKLEEALITSGPIKNLFNRIKFIFIPTHSNLPSIMNELIADEILPSMLDQYGEKGKLSQKIKELAIKIKSIDDLSKDIFLERSKLLTEKFQQVIDKFPEIKAGIPLDEYKLEVSLKEETLSKILSQRIELLIKDTSQVTIDSKGSGIQKITLITLLEYFSTNNEVKARYTSPFLIWAIDEPESFLQPNLQKEIRNIFRKVSETNQIIISTHSPHLIDINNIHNVKLFKLKVTPIPKENQKLKTYFEKETIVVNSNSTAFTSQLKEHLGIEKNDGWMIQSKNLLFEGMDDINYFHSTFNALMGYSLDCSNLSCNSSENMPNFTEILNQEFSEKKRLKLLCLLDNDTAGRIAFYKIKGKGFVSAHKTISLYLNDKDNQNNKYPSMIEDLVIPEVFLKSIKEFLLQKDETLDLDIYGIQNFKTKRLEQKRATMPEFLNNYFDEIINNFTDFCFKSLSIKLGISLKYKKLISNLSESKKREYQNKYPQLKIFLKKFE